MPLTIRGYAAQSASTPLAPFRFERRDPRADDVVIDILYCGICHTDLHQARDEWGSSIYPMVPGHEIIGRVSAIGPDVTAFKRGDIVGVGCMVDSCRHCDACAEGLEQYWHVAHKSGARFIGSKTFRSIIEQRNNYIRVIYSMNKTFAVIVIYKIGSNSGAN